jgi:hypothetical protein
MYFCDLFYSIGLTCGFMTTYKIGFQQMDVLAANNGTITTAGGTNLRLDRFYEFVSVVIFR